MPDIIQTIEQGAVIAWDEFKVGVKYVATEVEAVAAKVEQIDPGIQVQLQDLLKDGETAGLALAGVATGGATNYIAIAADGAETLLAQLLQGLNGGNLKGFTAAGVATIQQASAALQAAIPVAAAKIAGAIANEIPGANAGAVAAAVQTAATNPTS